MNDIAQQHRQALEATRTTVAGVRADQWAAPTPNEGWDVRALVNHIVSGNVWVVELVAGLLGRRPRHRWVVELVAGLLGRRPPHR